MRARGAVERAANIFLNQLYLPASKLNMGTPFYGYVYEISALWGTCTNCGSTVI
jgi:hypothetical protein